MTAIKIVGLAGSTNPRSSSLVALDLALAGARDQGAEIIRFDVCTLNLPLYAYGATPPEAEAYINAVRECDGMIWCSPLYHGTIPGSFKNALDWLELLSKDDPPYLTNRVIGLAATAGGSQALQAINTMEYVVRALRGWTLPFTVPVAGADHAFDAHGNARDDALGRRLHMLGTELARGAALLRP